MENRGDTGSITARSHEVLPASKQRSAMAAHVCCMLAYEPAGVQTKSLLWYNEWGPPPRLRPSKVALPGFFSGKEMRRSLSSCDGDIDSAAEQLKAKHAFLCKHGWEKGIDVSAVEGELRKGYVHLLLDQTDRDGRPIIHFHRSHVGNQNGRQQPMDVNGRGRGIGAGALERA
jgi:hypothetical protein